MTAETSPRFRAFMQLRRLLDFLAARPGTLEELGDIIRLCAAALGRMRGMQETRLITAARMRNLI